MRAVVLLAVLAIIALTTILALRAPEPALEVAGGEALVFDSSAQACDAQDYPDLPARALRRTDGTVSLTIAHMANRRMVGPDFRRLTHPSHVTLRSDEQADPARWNDREWIASTWTPDGTTVHALVHNEYHGHRRPGRCRSGSYRRCWWNAVTLAASTDGGATFTQDAAPGHLIAGPHVPYTPDTGPVGVFAPSNIVRSPSDGWLYALAHVEGPRTGSGVCLLRTRTPGDASSWQAWRRTGFGAPARASAPACRRVAPHRIATMSSSVTWNTELDRFVLVGTMASGRDGEDKPGIWYATSENLREWSPPIRIFDSELPSTYRCGDPDPIAYPSLVDHDSPSRNFDVTGRRAFLYFTRMRYERCRQTENRDLVRVPIESER